MKLYILQTAIEIHNIQLQMSFLPKLDAFVAYTSSQNSVAISGEKAAATHFCAILSWQEMMCHFDQMIRFYLYLIVTLLIFTSVGGILLRVLQILDITQLEIFSYLTIF